MTLDELRAQHPDLYNKIIQAGRDEMHRQIMAHLVWIEADPKGVVAAITAKEEFTAQNLSAYNMAALKNKALENRAADNPPPLNPEPTAADEKKKFSDELDTALEMRFGVKPEGGK